MSELIRFHCDENLTTAIATGLRRRGIEVTTTPEAGLLSATDEEQLEFANKEGRVMITQDTDFLRLHANGAEHAGIAFYRQGARSIGQALTSLIEIYERLTPDEACRKVFYL